MTTFIYVPLGLEQVCACISSLHLYCNYLEMIKARFLIGQDRHNKKFLIGHDRHNKKIEKNHIRKHLTPPPPPPHKRKNDVI